VGAFTPTTGIEGCDLIAAKAGLREWGAGLVANANSFRKSFQVLRAGMWWYVKYVISYLG